MHIADLIGRKVGIHTILFTGHHDFRFTNVGTLRAVENNLVLIECTALYGEENENEPLERYNPPTLIWFNTMAAHFGSVELARK